MIACLTETWFDTMNGAFSKSIKNSGYEIFHSYRDDKRGGGTAILYRRTLKIKQCKASTNAFLSFEYSYICFTLFMSSTGVEMQQTLP